MKYYFSTEAPQQQYISITVQVPSAQDTTLLKFPRWRPGRYELGEFAKNVKSFQIFDVKGKPCDFNKLDHSTWKVETSNTESITVKYSYYAADLNAGSTYLDSTQLYVNPVNCCVYVDELANTPHELVLDIPKEWRYAGPLEKNNFTLTASSFDELADSPFISSADLQHKTYSVAGTTFHIWFNGLVKLDWKKLITDFESFTAKQIEKFGEFPTDEYHFLFQIVPYKAYHGVEHSNCTVITLGPSYAVFGSLYKELLGVSSHELYHTWNVKAIRPGEMMPYDFSKENYSHLGYISEGVTTYMGDLFLYKSGVFSLQQYLNEMDNQLQRHFDNPGRFNYSVAESSWDTWLDGYIPGAPGRKVSIYTEGCLLAFALDVILIRDSGGKANLDKVMHYLYRNFALKNKGVSKEDYLDAINKVSGLDLNWLFDTYFYGTKSYETLLVECFDAIGLELNQEPSKDRVAAYLGAKTMQENNETVVLNLFPGGALDLAGAMIGDKIMSINGIRIENNLQEWLDFFIQDELRIVVNRKNKMHELILFISDKIYFERYWLSVKDNLSEKQQNCFQVWSTH